MPTNTFTTTTTTGYGSRIGKSIGGVVTGVVMFLGAFGLLYWNEGRVDMSTIAKTAVEMPSTSATVGEEFQGKFVSTSGVVTSDEKLGDGLFLNEGDYLAVDRTAEMYAWIEEKKENTEKNTGGSETTTTTYTYKMGWTTDPMEAVEMQHAEDHTNPPMTIENEYYSVSKLSVGSVNVSVHDGARLPPSESLVLKSDAVTLQKGDDMTAEYIFRGLGIQSEPMLGDVRIKYAVLLPGFEGTVFGMMNNSGIGKYTDEAGNSLFRVFEGSRTAAIATLHTEHVVLGWILRVIGFALMWLGLMGILGPLSTILDVLPFLGGASRFTVSLVTFPVALALSVATILISMILHSVVALIIAVVVLIGAAIVVAKRFSNKTVAA